MTARTALLAVVFYAALAVVGWWIAWQLTHPGARAWWPAVVLAALALLAALVGRRVRRG